MARAHPTSLKARQPRIVVFGAGAGGSTAFEVLSQSSRVLAFIDNDRNKQGCTLYGVPILPPDRLHDLSYDQVVIASDYKAEIYIQLTNVLGVPDWRIHEFSAIAHTSRSNRVHFRGMAMRALCVVPPRIGPLLLAALQFASRDFRNLLTLPICWLDENPSLERVVVRPAHQANVPGPRFIGGCQNTLTVTVPPETIDVFYDAQITTASPGLIANGRLFVERVPSAQRKAADYRSGQILEHSNRTALVRIGDQHHLERGIAITAYNATNYYHIVIEALSKLAYLEYLHPSLADAPLLMSESIAKIPSIQRFVEILARGRTITYLANNTLYNVAKLVWVSSPNLIVPNLYPPARNTPAECFVRPESITFLSSVMKEQSFVAARTKPQPRRIFLARRGSLRQYNQDEVETMLAKHGFTTVYMENHTLEEQAALFHEAELIVGPTGAAWTNIIFARAGASALSWIAEEVGDASCYSALAETVGVNLRYITYSAGTKNTREIYYKQYRVSVEEIRTWLENIHS